MDRGGDELIGWSIDGMAAGLLGIAAGACLLLLGLAGAAVVVGPLLGIAALAVLRQVRPEPRRFRLPDFALDPVELGAPKVEPELDLLELTDALAPEPLELEDRLDEPATDSRVVQLFAPRPLPTPGELARRIESHLGGGEERGGKVLELEVDASAALREALGELRQSLA
jgi:hypothetical protein